MRAQSSCFGFTAPPTDGLFFALFPDSHAAERLATLAAQQCIRHRLTGRPLAAARFHVSLLGVGVHARLPGAFVAAAKTAAAGVTSSPFEVTFDRAMSFTSRPRPRVVCSRSAALIAFQRALARAVEQHGFGRVKPQYAPHVTLLYDERAIEEYAVEPIHWTAREFVLVHSRRGEGYVPLARWPLRAALSLAS
jgi:2'-5' RNA ligase